MNPSSLNNFRLELKDKNFRADYYSRHKIIQAMEPEVDSMPFHLATAACCSKKKSN